MPHLYQTENRRLWNRWESTHWFFTPENICRRIYVQHHQHQHCRTCYHYYSGPIERSHKSYIQKMGGQWWTATNTAYNDILHSQNTLSNENIIRVYGSGDNLLKNRSRASTSEYKQLPINLRLFQNTVKLLALGAVQYSFRLNIAFTHLNMLPVPNFW